MTSWEPPAVAGPLPGPCLHGSSGQPNARPVRKKKTLAIASGNLILGFNRNLIEKSLEITLWNLRPLPGRCPAVARPLPDGRSERPNLRPGKFNSICQKISPGGDPEGPSPEPARGSRDPKGGRLKKCNLEPRDVAGAVARPFPDSRSDHPNSRPNLKKKPFANRIREILKKFSNFSKILKIFKIKSF